MLLLLLLLLLELLLLLVVVVVVVVGRDRGLEVSEAAVGCGGSADDDRCTPCTRASLSIPRRASPMPTGDDAPTASSPGTDGAATVPLFAALPANRVVAAAGAVPLPSVCSTPLCC